MRNNEGRYIRPILLVRVERTGKEQRDKNNIHSEDVREYLVEKLGAQPDQIKVKSAELDELDKVDLLSDLCPVRCIITKDALREGWDCPFAYILAVLSKTTAATALTQMIGRVLRQPEARQPSYRNLRSSLTTLVASLIQRAMQSRIPALLFSVIALTIHAAPLEFASPDGKVRFQLATNAEGHLLYSVTAGGQLRLEPARAGVLVEGSDLGSGVILGAPQSRRISEVFPWRGNKTTATNLCQAFEVPVRTQAGVAWTIEVRVFNDGIGFRYRVPGDGHTQNPARIHQLAIA